LIPSSNPQDISRPAAEFVDAILAAFLKEQDRPVEKARRLLIMRRKGLI